MTRDTEAVAREHLAREQGTVHKDWGGKLPVAIIYPNSYYLGMSNLGIQAIYTLLNHRPDIVCERVFWEKPENGSLVPSISVESQRPLTDFAVLAFSVTYELDYFNIPQILRAAGIPLFSRERDETHPLIIAGGACITANPMPVAPFFDCVCIGEAEVILPSLLPALKQGTEVSRGEAFALMARVPGVYVPQHPKSPVVRQWAHDLDDFPVHSAVLTPDTELGDLYLIEVERGCPWGCRFCLVCGAFWPMRHHSAESLIAQARVGLKYRRRLGLVGPAVSDHPQFDQLLSALKAMGAEISVSSLRIKPLHSLALSELARGGTNTVALAPEAGSERLRRVIKKGINEDDILAAVQQVSQYDIAQLRLYFMIGLPTETDDDAKAIADLSLKCKEVLEKKKSTTRIVLSVPPFVPKPGTPFQWLPMEDLSVVRRRLSGLRNRLEPNGIKVAGDSPAWSEVQAVLARGDDKMAGVLAEVKEASLPEWRKALKKHGLEVDSYAHRKFATDSDLPWLMIDSGIGLDHLKAEVERALSPSSHEQAP
jgi:radical SAM superfamily enzyme YgiQ (UPF0313 family)